MDCNSVSLIQNIGNSDLGYSVDLLVFYTLSSLTFFVNFTKMELNSLV